MGDRSDLWVVTATSFRPSPSATTALGNAAMESTEVSLSQLAAQAKSLHARYETNQ